ncbi:UDP-glucose 4-epimerase GalE [Priestia megaterium]|uniref:UDP-glucose 4-epimerase GalE n=1 Tax=Priestia megaterium TaxID=1404 RepID=UPI0023DA4882|nr:UDP-glucose 4-epimerase GalE [Priestia megaterium]MDF2054917.1 UDP-glucose 4-epimerase GalE [Priestia megaterium]MDF2063041.1 UDP-glucose 4-epimerase GalE [Priestia megaterium]
MSILVTGGAGYIGSHTCLELLNAGYEIVVIDNLSNSKLEALNRVSELAKTDFKFYKIDLLNKKALETVFSENNIEAVIHFAGLKSANESIETPLHYYHNNITGTLTLCQTMRKYGVTKMIFSSSANVYGVTKCVPITEDYPLNPINPYGRTKLIIETILSDLYVSDQSWSIALLRYFNPIGAHESGRIGEDPNDIPNNLMPYITQVAIGKRDKLKVFGSDYDTHDGTGVRDYIHVVDLAKGHLKALEMVIQTTGIDTFNLGTGIGYSVLDLIKSYEKTTSQKIPYTFTHRRPGDIDKCYADTKKANEKLGWKATKNLEDMCRDAWEWQKNNPNGYNK